MAKKQTAHSTKSGGADLSPLVAAALTGIVYQARLFNRQARMNVPEELVISEVVNLWHTVTDALDRRTK
jgi:hypothetical protein